MAHLAEEPYITPRLLKSLLTTLAVEYNAENKETLDIYVVGGSALQLKYGTELREVTFDGDAYWVSENEVDITKYIEKVSADFGIPTDWLNSDFKFTNSFSEDIIKDAVITSTLGRVNVYVVSDLTQTSMKVTSDRPKDLLDAIRLAEKIRDKNDGTSGWDLDKTVKSLYKNKDNVNRSFLNHCMKIIDRKMSQRKIDKIKASLIKSIERLEARKQKIKNIDQGIPESEIYIPEE